MLSLSIRKVLSQLRDGKISAKDLCEKCLERARRAKELNFLITETSNWARQAAVVSSNRLNKNKPFRRLEGIPIVFKDNFSTKGVRTTCGSRMLANYVPPYNSTMVQRSVASGAVLIGKSNMDEFAMGSGNVDSCVGPAINPWGYTFKKLRHKKTRKHEDVGDSTNKHAPGEDNSDSASDWYIPGGSSGGSAVAVATGASFAAFGSDTGGSVRLPASFCGVVGFKPTYGLLSRHGLIPLMNSTDVPGILTRTAEDAAIVLNSVAGHDVYDSTTVRDKFHPVSVTDDVCKKDLHIGIPKEYLSQHTSPEVVSAWRRAADMFEDAGVRVSEISLPHTQYANLCYTVLCCCEVASNMARYDGIEFGLRGNVEESTEELYAQGRHKGFNHIVRRRILIGNYFLLKRNYDRYFIQAQKIRRLISEDFRRVFQSGVNVMLTPSAEGSAPLYQDYSKREAQALTEDVDLFLQAASLAGIPAISVPASLSSKGLPLGLQFMANHFQEQRLLSAAHWYEQRAKFPKLNLDVLDT